MRSRNIIAAILLIASISLSSCGADKQLAELHVKEIATVPYETDAPAFDISDTAEITETEQTDTESFEETTTTQLITEKIETITEQAESETIETTVLSTDTANVTEYVSTEVEAVEPVIYETTALDTVSEMNNTQTVYWVEKGEVWHTKSSCPSLSRSKNIISGSLSDAKSAGKERVCKRCGG